ncbi:MAG TPA: nuclear transport factor 2 family protein [Candidatus Udaeobacter sp.]|jgi:predicted ester cyclase
MNSQNLSEFAKRYAQAWCSQNPESVAAFFAENASLTVNGGPSNPPLEVARGFMRDFPDMVVAFDKLEARGERTAFHWTLTGTYAETGKRVRISGYELWKINNAGLIAESTGHFDAADYESQVKGAPEL